MKKTTISLAFSPCPNDTFIFDALINGKINNRGLKFDPVLKDVEELNNDAFSRKYDITKLSFASYPAVADEYIILDAGAALGSGVGPLLVSRGNKEISKDSSVAIPGKHTTANLLFSMFYPECRNKTEMVFHEIPDAVAEGVFDYGILIHEGRFTYQNRGLVKISDLGDEWEKSIGLPIPLGCIIGKREMGNETLNSVNEMISESIQYAFQNPGSGMEYIRLHAQELENSVIKKHIELYVNDYSIDLGEKGRNAVEQLLTISAETGNFPDINKNIFLEKAI